MTSVSERDLGFLLAHLPGSSRGKDRLPMHMEGIRIQKYLEKKLLHSIKCSTATFLAAFMWRRPLNSVDRDLYPQKIKSGKEGNEN